MSDPFVGQILLFGGNFAPKGWAMCNGQLMSIAQNTALFSLLGTMYGGDGMTTFALPDLRGRAPIGMGQGPGLSSYAQGEAAGTETTTLNISNLPAHTHTLFGASGPASGPDRGIESQATAAKVPSNDEMAPTGSNAPFDNRSPYLAMNYIIALEGIYPSRG
jgi:microcystin-dependent protein